MTDWRNTEFFFFLFVPLFFHFLFSFFILFLFFFLGMANKKDGQDGPKKTAPRREDTT